MYYDNKGNTYIVINVAVPADRKCRAKGSRKETKIRVYV